MRGKFLHRIGALILAVVMLSGVALLGGTTAQAWPRRRVIIAPRIYVGPRPHRQHWRRHWRRYRW
jgi:hypothetical protein